MKTAPATIENCLWANLPFRLSATAKTVWQGKPNPSNLWPKRAETQYINCVLLTSIMPRRNYWRGMEYYPTKLLPLSTPVWPAS
jgi:hypothetical protein